MKTLILSPDLHLPLEAVTETFGLLAVRRAGKSSAARVMAEEFFREHLHFVAIDPVGSWYGLRSSRDGKSPGLPIPIFGGRHGDVPLEPTGGVLIADLVVNERLSCVLDVSQFESEAAKKRFLLDFARRLYLKNQDPLHVFLEEADDYIPQRPQHDDAQLLRAWENLVRRGGQRGIGCTIISQRSASVNKSVLTQVQTLIALRTTGPQDRAAIGDWVEHNAQEVEILKSLSSLQDGEAWVWSPNFLQMTKRFRFRLPTTFDSGATPKVGATRKVTTLADVDLGAVQTQMAATIERAKATDPKALQARIAELEREVALKLPPPAPPVRPAKVVEVRLIKPRQQRQLEKLVVRYEQTVRDLNRQAGTLTAYEHSLALHVEGLRSVISPPKPCDNPLIVDEHSGRTLAVHADQGPARPSRVIKPDDGRPLRLPGGSGDLGSGERKVLHAIRMFPNAPARVGFVSGYVRGGSTYRKYVSTLRSVGLVERGVLQVTAAGAAAAGPVPPSTIDGVLDYWRARLGAGERRIFDAVLVAPTAAVPAIVAEQAGFELGGSTWRKYVSTLRSLGLLVRGRELRAAPELFA